MNDGKNMSTAALVCGILGIVGSFIPYVSYFTLVLAIIAIVLGVKFDGDRIQAVRVIEHHETPGIGAKALESLPAAAVAGNGKVDSISGATITTKGFREAIADAIKNHSAKKQ